uniref:hypothetical protein n=1 Tax=Lentzea alba TaxID=2714351 RepID=UPI0039BF2638
MVAAFAAVSCSSGTQQQQASTQEKYFDVTGFGKLKPGMSRQDALATGELAATGAGKTGTCEDYRYQGAPAPDPKELAADEELEQKIAAAQKEADAAKAAIGPEPGPNAGAAEYAASAERLAASAEASNKVVQLTVQSTDRIVKRAEAREANGGVMFAGDKIRMILPPPGATTSKNIGKGATVDQLKAAHPNVVGKDDKTFEVPVPDQPGFVLGFSFVGGKLDTFMLFNGDTTCG